MENENGGKWEHIQGIIQREASSGYFFSKQWLWIVGHFCGKDTTTTGRIMQRRQRIPRDETFAAFCRRRRQMKFLEGRKLYSKIELRRLSVGQLEKEIREVQAIWFSDHWVPFGMIMKFMRLFWVFLLMLTASKYFPTQISCYRDLLSCEVFERAFEGLPVRYLDRLGLKQPGQEDEWNEVEYEQFLVEYTGHVDSQAAAMHLRNGKILHDSRDLEYNPVATIQEDRESWAAYLAWKYPHPF